MNNLSKLAVILLTVLVTTGCSYIYGEDGLIKDRAYEYIEARQAKELKIPGDLVQEDKANYAQVPTIGKKAQSAPSGKELEVGAPIQLLAVLENMRINKQSEHPSVFISDSAINIWQSIVKMFEENEITPAVMDQKQYYLDSGWVAVDERGVWLGIENREEVDEFRAKFKITITPGNLKGEQSLTVERIQAQKFDDESDKWENQPTFWQDSAEMLNLIISSYDVSVSTREREMRKRAIAGFKVKLGKDSENNAALVTAAEKEDVWQKLPRVLEALQFEMSDRDRTLMTYFIEYKYEEPGFFASLFDDEVEKLPIEPGNYQVTLSELGEQTAITFKDGAGQPLEAALMVKLYPSLSQLFGDKR
ncbi:MAG: outer membrane protein assembly factor BamC [Kangiellaceae bacterium]|nr:outer membrane protein assembly factor BamC [Kangiellaceae bacterium]